MRKCILGTDWWTDCDDAVAVRLLARAAIHNEIEFIGVGINACMPYSAASLDAFLASEGLTDIPIGIDLAAVDFLGRLSDYQKNLAPHAKRYRSNTDAEDAVRLYRRLLAASDTPVELVEIGFLQVLANVLESGADDISPLTGTELVREKVAKVWVMAGKWDENPGAEHNFNNNPRSCDGGARFCAKCPVPVTFLGFEVGVSVITGGLTKNGGVLTEDDMLYHVMCDHGSADGRMSWDPMTALLAVIGDEAAAGYDTVVGTASVDPVTGENRFIPDEQGLHRYVVKARPDAYYRDTVHARIASK